METLRCWDCRPGGHIRSFLFLSFFLFNFGVGVFIIVSVIIINKISIIGSSLTGVSNIIIIRVWLLPDRSKHWKRRETSCSFFTLSLEDNEPAKRWLGAVNSETRVFQHHFPDTYKHSHYISYPFLFLYGFVFFPLDYLETDGGKQISALERMPWTEIMGGLFRGCSIAPLNSRLGRASTFPRMPRPGLHRFVPLFKDRRIFVVERSKMRSCL